MKVCILYLYMYSMSGTSASTQRYLPLVSLYHLPTSFHSSLFAVPLTSYIAHHSAFRDRCLTTIIILCRCSVPRRCHSNSTMSPQNPTQPISTVSALAAAAGTPVFFPPFSLFRFFAFFWHKARLRDDALVVVWSSSCDLTSNCPEEAKSPIPNLQSPELRPFVTGMLNDTSRRLRSSFSFRWLSDKHRRPIKSTIHPCIWSLKLINNVDNLQLPVC